MTGEPDRFLLRYHQRHAGATARCFAGGRADDGRSSYQLLADLPAPGDRVLDLGCGDGHLLELLIARGVTEVSGLDMSAAELALARRRPALAGVRLLEERAQASSLPAASFDWILSHLAFMLMSEVEAVVAEIARLLAPGGRFATVVGGGPASAEDDGFALFVRLLQEEAERAPERAPPIGDRRTRDAAGFAALFHPGTGFEAEVAESAHTVRLDAGAAELWRLLGDNPPYQLLALEPAAVARLRARFLAEAPALADRSGLVPCRFRMRLLVARRR